MSLLANNNNIINQSDKRKIEAAEMRFIRPMAAGTGSTQPREDNWVAT